MAVTAPKLAYIEQRTTSRGLAVFGLTAAYTRKAVAAHRPITKSAPQTGTSPLCHSICCTWTSANYRVGKIPLVRKSAYHLTLIHPFSFGSAHHIIQADMALHAGTRPLSYHGSHLRQAVVYRMPRSGSLNKGKPCGRGPELT